MNYRYLIILVLVLASIGIVGTYSLFSIRGELEEYEIFNEKSEHGEYNFDDCIDGHFIADSSLELVEIEMVVYQWKFGYCSITVYEGQTIELKLRSLDVPHGMSIEGKHGFNVFISPNTVSSIRFEADRKGTFLYFCTVFCGEGHPNHKGILIVK